MSELADLVSDWLKDKNKDWYIINYGDLSDLLLYGKHPARFVAIIFDDRVLLNDYVWPYRVIAEGKQIVYATNPEFFNKIHSVMIKVEEVIANDPRP